MIKNIIIVGLVLLFTLFSSQAKAQSSPEELAGEFSTLELFNVLFSLDETKPEDQESIVNITMILKHKYLNSEPYSPPLLRITCNKYLSLDELGMEMFTYFIEGYFIGLDRAYMGDLSLAAHNDSSIIINTTQDICKEDRSEVLGLAMLKAYLRLIKQKG